MAIKKLTDVQYTDHDVLRLEINVRPAGQVWDFGLLKQGKQEIEIHARNLPKLLNLVSTEEENEEFIGYELTYSRQKAKLQKELADKFGENSEAYERELYRFYDRTNPYKRFFEDHGSEPKPIKSVKVIENLGPRIDDAIAAQKQNATTNEQIVQLMAMMTEMMKQNKQATK